MVLPPRISREWKRRVGLGWEAILIWGFLLRRSWALGFVLGSNPVVGVDLGPDLADHAKKLGQDEFSIFLLGALHALHLAPGSLLHFCGQVSLGAHGLEGEEGVEEKTEETEKRGSRHVEEKVLEQGQRERPSSPPIPRKQPDTRTAAQPLSSETWHATSDCTAPTLTTQPLTSALHPNVFILHTDCGNSPTRCSRPSKCPDS